MRYLVISDLHENYVGLVDMLDLATQSGGYDGIWFLGDAIGHCEAHDFPCEAIDCLSLLREKKAICVIGNWEGWLHRPEWDENGHQKRHKQDLDFLRQRLPIEFSEEIRDNWKWIRTEAESFTLTHGCPYQRHTGPTYQAEPWETYLRSTDTNEIRRIFMLDKITTEHLIIGHTHEPGYFHYNGTQALWHALTPEMINQDIIMDSYGGRYVLNPGSLSYNLHCVPWPTALLLDTTARTFRFLKLEGAKA